MKLKNVFVMAENQSTLIEMCLGARSLGEKVSAIVIGSKESTAIISKSCDNAFWLGDLTGKVAEDFVLTVVELLKKFSPELVLVAPTIRYQLLIGRVAAKLGTAVMTESIDIKIDHGVVSTRMAYGGLAHHKQKLKSGMAIVTVGAGVLPKGEGVFNGTVEQFPFVTPHRSFVVKSKSEKAEGKTTDLRSAKRVIAVGRGISKKEDLEMINSLAKAIGADVGCSRPIAEGENWLPKDLYIGVSGLMLKPELYIAIGISGQIQHMVGCNSSGQVISINKDKNAPVFKQSDFGVVADLYKVVPALIEKLK